MKKIFLSVVSMLLCFALLAPTLTAFAETGEAQPEWEDVDLTEEEINDILGNDTDNLADPYTVGLIMIYALTIFKDGNTLHISGETRARSDVVKCGFKKVVVQRKAFSTTTWTDYVTYENLYADTNGYALEKSLTVPSGYQYRVTCVHYAKKNIFSTEKINNTSNVISF